MWFILQKGKVLEKIFEIRELGPQRIKETLAKDRRHARKELTTSLIEFPCRTSQVRVRAPVKCEPNLVVGSGMPKCERSGYEIRASQVRVRIQLSFIFSLLFISSDCYSRNDVQVVNGKINFQVCSIFHGQSLEPFNGHPRPMFLSFSYSFIFYILMYIYLVMICKNNGKNKLKLKLNTAVERYATSFCVYNSPKKIKIYSCIHLKQIPFPRLKKRTAMNYYMSD